MADKFFYSEYFDGNPGTLNSWATSPPMSSRSLVTDFTLHWALQSACDGGQAQVLNGAGYIAQNPFLACTFVDNPDTDTSDGEAVTTAKLLAYAFMLTAEGYPFVYGKDYFPPTVWPGACGLKHWIDNLIWIHETLANGPTVTRHVDAKVIVLNRTGWPGLLTALNFDTLNARTITCDTAFGPGVALHDYTGRHPDIRTDGNGRATFEYPVTPSRTANPIFAFHVPTSSSRCRGTLVPPRRCFSVLPIWIPRQPRPAFRCRRDASGARQALRSVLGYRCTPREACERAMSGSRSPRHRDNNCSAGQPTLMAQSRKVAGMRCVLKQTSRRRAVPHSS